MTMAKTRALILIVAVFGSAALDAQVVDPALAGVPAAVSYSAPVAAIAETEVDATPLTLLVGRSTVVNVGSPITRVSLTSADVADALVTSPSELLVHGKVPGSISMFVWNRAGA